MILGEDCLFRRYDGEIVGRTSAFDCGDADLNEFFSKDALNYDKQLLGRSYCFVSLDKGDIVAAFTLSNSAIRVADLPNNAKRKLSNLIPWVKQGRNYPAVLIGRLGVGVPYRNQGVGSQVLNFIKAWFLSGHNKTGCRFIVVDAYNKSPSLRFYQKNEFAFLFKDEEQEKAYNGISPAESLNTRQMFFDLLKLL